MEGLPQIIIPRILSCLEVKAACRCACISRAWAFATQHDPIARKIRVEKPMGILLDNGDERTIWLLRRGLDAQCPGPAFTGYTPMHLGAFHGYVDFVRALLDSGGVCMDSKNKKGKTPLFIATSKNHILVVKDLLSRGANVDAADEEGWTPLMVAAAYGFLPLVEVLLCGGAAVDARSQKMQTALMLASCSHRCPIVQTLIDSGANMDLRDTEEKTALQYAEYMGHIQVVRLLQDADTQRSTNLMLDL